MAKTLFNLDEMGARPNLILQGKLQPIRDIFLAAEKKKEIAVHSKSLAFGKFFLVKC